MAIHLCAVCDECDADIYYPWQSPAEAFERWHNEKWLLENIAHGTLCPVCRIEKGIK